MVLHATRRAGGALPPRRSLCSQPPGARGCAPLPPDPYPRQAELAGFCALPRACCAARRCVCARARSDPYVCAGAWCCTPHGALVARSCRAARSARGPRGRGAARPYPRTPTRGKLSLQAFARCARAALCAGVSVLAHGATRMFVLAHAATRRLSPRSVVADARARGKDDGDAGGFDARADGVAQVLGVAVGE